MADDNQGHSQHTVLAQKPIKNAAGHHLLTCLAGPPRKGIKQSWQPWAGGAVPARRRFWVLISVAISFPAPQSSRELADFSQVKYLTPLYVSKY